jgi:hypothetical protein
MSPSNDTIPNAIRREGRLRFTIANTHGDHSGWFEGVFYDYVSAREHARKTGPSTRALHYLWTLRKAGIPESDIRQRFDPFKWDRNRDEQQPGTEKDQIPLWADPKVDFRQNLNGSGPWTEDLTNQDRARAAWGTEAWRYRSCAAGHIQAIKDRQLLDGVPPLFDHEGLLCKPTKETEKLRHVAQKHPLIGQLLAAIAGPKPSAEDAQKAALLLFSDPPSTLELLSSLALYSSPNAQAALDDNHFSGAMGETLFLALLDSNVTDEGRYRPWLARDSANKGLSLKRTPIDLTAPLKDICSLWSNGITAIGLLDTGHFLTEKDFPVPLDELSDAVAEVRLESSIDDAEASVQALLEETREAQQWSIPWGARVEVEFGPFVALRIFHHASEINCLFLDKNERYWIVAIELGLLLAADVDQIPYPRGDNGQAGSNLEAMASLKLIAAAVVRDFSVVEERESLFTARPLRRRIGGRCIRTIIYLPRVRYSTPHPERTPLEGSAAKRARHWVAPHVRRAQHSSPAQLFLARRYGIQVPIGFTFVRPHERGAAASPDQIHVYRSRSASRMIFEEVARAPEGSRPKWFEFEKDCARLLRNRNYTAVHRAVHRDGDGGVDIFATDPDGITYVVQCKCWAANRPVGPDVVRELAGAIQLADVGSVQRSQGILITSSRFTNDATSAAAELSFELIDGERLATLLL